MRGGEIDDEPARVSRSVVLPHPDGPMMASTSPGRECPLTPSRISTGGAPWAPPATVTRTSSHVRNTVGSSASRAPGAGDAGGIISHPEPRTQTMPSPGGAGAPAADPFDAAPPPRCRPPPVAHAKTLPSDQPAAARAAASGVPPPQRQSGRDGLGVGAHRGSGDVAAMAS